MGVETVEPCDKADIRTAGGARGPGVFFIIPCIDTYEKIDMRSRKYEIPPQEVSLPQPSPGQIHQKPRLVW